MKKIIFIFILFFCQFSNTFAYTQVELKLYYDKIYSKIDSKFSGNNEKISKFLEKLDEKFTKILKKTNSKNKINVINSFILINKNKLNSLKFKNDTQNTTINHPEYILKILENGYTFLNVGENLEFLENDVFFRLNFKKYFEVNEDNYEFFIQKKINSGIILKYKNNYIIINDYTKEKKYNYTELKNIFTHTLDTQNSYFLENGVYYSYVYNYYIFIDKTDGLYISDLELNKIDPKNTLFIIDNNKYYFSNDYEKIRIVGENLIGNIKNKNDFLFNIVDDNKFFVSNYDDTLSEIKNTSLKLTSFLDTDEEKIKVIYNWIVENINYYKNYSDGSKEIFSGVLTYKNKIGVCDGYTKLFLYMLSFAGIDNVELKRGFAFDSVDFPAFGHAWVKVGNNYYDPTFDDPIGGNSKNEYLYFNIPQELMYVNRFDGINIPNDIKNLSLDDRKSLVLKNMYDIYEKYKEYPLMKEVKTKIFLGLQYNEKITIDKLSNKITFYEMKDGYLYDNIGNKKNIKGNFSYYPINNDNIDNIISSSKINIENMILIKWYSAGTFEYRLVYDLIIE